MPDLVDATCRPPAIAAAPVATAAEALSHFRVKLALETDPSDLHADLTAGHTGVIVLDSRSRDAYRHSHIPGAISLPHAEIDAESTRGFHPDAVVVAYCWGPGCNAAAKAGLRLAGLGLTVKELIGGIEYWRREGYPLAAGDEPGSLNPHLG